MEDSLIFKHKFVDRDNLLLKYELYCRQKPDAGDIWFRDIFNPLSLEIWLRQFHRYVS